MTTKYQVTMTKYHDGRPTTATVMASDDCRGYILYINGRFINDYDTLDAALDAADLFLD